MQIKEMYKAYGVKPLKQYTSCAWNSAENCPYSKDGNCIENCTQLFIVYEEYPPFTAEKQLKLIKLILSTGEELEIAKMDTCYRFWLNYTTIQAEDFPKALAGLVVALKNKLDHAKVKEILG